MVGRLDNWLKVVIEKEGIITDPGNLNWAGVAAMKKAYQLYKERGYHTRLLSAAYRHLFPLDRVSWRRYGLNHYKFLAETI